MLLLGVAIGVMVLMVVLAVMAGFEREIKSRILGFTPHIVLRYDALGMGGEDVDWRALSKDIEKVDGVEQSRWMASYDSWGSWLNASYRQILDF